MEKEPVIHACTDVTGFGLLGHCYEMAAGSGQSFFIDSKKIPALPGALDYASMGIVPANAYKNRGYLDGLVSISDSVPENVSDLLFDPQTSGGLLIAVPEAAGEGFLRRLKDLVPVAEIIRTGNTRFTSVKTDKAVHSRRSEEAPPAFFSGAFRRTLRRCTSRPAPLF